MFAAIFSGILSALSLPTAIGSVRCIDLGFVAWFSLVPFYLSLSRIALPKRAFFSGLLFGAVFYGISLYWIFIAMHRYGKVPIWGAFLGVLLAVLLMALFFAVAAALSVWMDRRGVPLMVGLPLTWVALDFLRNYFPFGGFSWASLAYTQGSFNLLLQGLDLTGVYGITFLIVFANAVFAELWFFFRKSSPSRSSRVLFLGAAFLAVWMGSFLLYGHLRVVSVRKAMNVGPRMKISMIQGNVPQEEKWLEEMVDEIINRYIFLTEEAQKAEKFGSSDGGSGELERSPDFIVWPEAAYPAAVPLDLPSIDAFKDIHKPLLMGAVTYRGVIPDEWPPKIDDPNFSLYNTALLIKPGGVIENIYRKRHLVPLGEYVPLQRVLFFLSKIVPSISSFTPGKEWKLMSVGEGKKFGVTICYEDLFPEIARAFTRKGADFLVNITNDAWYERSSAVYQHVDFSKFRAIENRRSMVRATNTGVTAFFDPTGEVIAQAPIFQEAVLTADVPVWGKGGPLSFYTRFGDVFAWSCVILLSMLLIRSMKGAGGARKCF